MKERVKNCQKHIDNKTHIYYYICDIKEIIKVTYEQNVELFSYKMNQKSKENSILQEENETYEIVSKTQIHQKNDKTYRNLLMSKKDATHIINEVLHIEAKKEIKPEEIEAYNSSFINKQFKNKEADIVYKMKEKDIFFLIEHQSKVDYSMPYRIQEYQAEIIRQAIDEKRIKSKGYKMPEVIPIVVYTGKDKWNASIYLHKIQDERFAKINLLQYNLIDINKYTQQKLITSEYLIDKMFLIERARNRKEFEKAIKESIITLKSEEDTQKLMEIIELTLKSNIGENLIKKEEGDDEDMEAVLERVIEYERKDAVRTIINNMILNGITREEIEKITGVTKDEIEKIAKKVKYEKNT